MRVRDPGGNGAATRRESPPAEVGLELGPLDQHPRAVLVALQATHRDEVVDALALDSEQLGGLVDVQVLGPSLADDALDQCPACALFQPGEYAIGDLVEQLVGDAERQRLELGLLISATVDAHDLPTSHAGVFSE